MVGFWGVFVGFWVWFWLGFLSGDFYSGNIASTGLTKKYNNSPITSTVQTLGKRATLVTELGFILGKLSMRWKALFSCPERNQIVSSVSLVGVKELCHFN